MNVHFNTINLLYQYVIYRLIAVVQELVMPKRKHSETEVIITTTKLSYKARTIYKTTIQFSSLSLSP